MSKKEMILDVATRLFAEKGFDGTSVRGIAEKAGLSVPGMFHYFPSKEEILREIMIGFMDAGYKGLMEIYNSDKDPVKKLVGICRYYVEYYAGHKDQLTILVTEGKALSPEHSKVFIEKQRIYLQAIKNLFGELAGCGHLKQIHSSVLAFIFFGMVNYTYKWYNPDGEMSPDELGDIFSKVFLYGILKNNNQ
jgi:AcrR family transcriptional regulator